MNPATLRPVLAVLLVLIGGVVLAHDLHRGALVLAGEHLLAGAEGHVLVVGGRVAAASAVRIEGSVVVLGGAFALEGTVVGDIFHLGGELEVRGGARVDGRLVAVAGDLAIDPAAVIAGGVLRDLEAATELVRPAPTLAQRGGRLLVQIALLALLALAAARLVPRALDRTSEALSRHAVVSVSMGALSGLVGTILLVAMVFTVVLIPVAVVGLVLAATAIGWGWLAWGRWIGRALARRGWAPRADPLATAAGAAVFVAGQALVAAVPWVGGPLALAASVAALGAALLTGFGGRRFVPDATQSDPAA